MFQVTGPGGHDQEGVEALHGDHAHHPGDRAVLIPEDLLHLRVQGLHLRVLELEETDRHAVQPVHVEDLHELHGGFELLLCPRQDQQIALLVHDLGRIGGQERLDELVQLTRRDIAQRHDPDPIPPRGRDALHRDRRRTAGRLGPRHDLVEAIGTQQHRPVQAQQVFEGGQELGAFERAAGLDGHLTGHLGVDEIALLEEVAEDRLDDLLEIGGLEVERVFPARVRRPGCHHLRVHEVPGAGVHLDVRTRRFLVLAFERDLGHRRRGGLAGLGPRGGGDRPRRRWLRALRRCRTRRERDGADAQHDPPASGISHYPAWRPMACLGRRSPPSFEIPSATEPTITCRK